MTRTPKLKRAQLAELEALAEVNDTMAGPAFIHRSNLPLYQGLIDAGLVEWGAAPAGFDNAAFAGVSITEAGREALARAPRDGGLLSMTPLQRNLARHALGLPNDRKRSYRNSFHCPSAGDAFDHWTAMVKVGLAEQSVVSRGRVQFWLTRGGAEAALVAGETLCPEDFPE